MDQQVIEALKHYYRPRSEGDNVLDSVNHFRIYFESHYHISVSEKAVFIKKKGSLHFIDKKKTQHGSTSH